MARTPRIIAIEFGDNYTALQPWRKRPCMATNLPKSRPAPWLQVNQESFEELLKIYELPAFDDHQEFHYYNPKFDMLYFEGFEQCAMLIGEVLEPDKGILRVAFNASGLISDCCTGYQDDHEAESIMRDLHGFHDESANNLERSSSR